MKLPIFTFGRRLFAPLIPSLFLVACGGGGQTESQAPTVVAAPSAPVAAPAPAVTEVPTAPPVPPQQSIASPGTIGNVVTDLSFESTSSTAQSNVPVTFGQVFAPGDLLAGVSVAGQMADGSLIPLQMDAKARHADGSVRHAIFSAVLPNLAVNDVRVLKLARTTAATSDATPATPATLLAAGFSASVKVIVDGLTYSVAADDLLKVTGYKTWLAGPAATEWQVSSPLKTAAGVAHPHLAARFAVRWYGAANKARVDVTVENDWAYEAAPRNFTYDAQILVGGQKVYDKGAMTHYHHARWRKTFWWGEAPQVHIRHNSKYLIASLAVPNYDQSVVTTEANLAALSAQYTGAKTEPMGVGLASSYMPETGARPDIGILPGWSAQYLLSMDKRAKDGMLGTADLAGSWSLHYRDQKTDRPISVLNYPYMTVMGNQSDTFNPATQKFEAFPSCATAGGCTTPNQHDTSHQPGLAYLPYLVTGDHYYLEELQFWAMYDVFASNPGYRENIKGLLISDQIRGMAWSLRTLSEAAYISPTQDSLKSHFDTFLSNTLDWYNNKYSDNATANSLGFIANGTVYAYADGTGIAPWQDDFFTAAVGRAAELGFSKAVPLLTWKAKFPIGRMTAPGACWIKAAMYRMVVRDTATAPVYATMAQAYQSSVPPELHAMACGSAEMAANLQLRVGEMTGYSSESTGYPSNLQPALAYSARAGGPSGSAAWALFMSRSVKPNYAAQPQFAIMPR